MGFILQGILELIEKIGEAIIAGGIVILNLLFTGLEAAVNGVVALLPSLPEIVPPPEYVEDVNWFFPVGSIVSIATGLLVSYGIFLGVRWLLVKTGLIGGG